MISHYDPGQSPDPTEWLALDEGQRTCLVENYHRDARIPLPKSARRMHAAIHTIVENQLALEDEAAVRATLLRLTNEGLSRHDAIHAIGSVLAELIYNQLHGNADASGNEGYYAALETLAADKWRNG